MSIREGICDWCGRGRLLETGDETSRVQLGKLWCGQCRAGSKERYKNHTDKFLEGQIKIMEELLEQHPLQWEPPYDHPRMHMFKLDNQDEVWRMTKELEFRRQDEDKGL